MKKLLFPVVTAVLLCGCASSERAFRMSGGVFDSYSAPKNYRTRSEKFQKMDQMSIPHRANKNQVSGINDTLINIWPFYFRNNAYFSVLWPMIDWDPYGMAIRPFYNQEGDDYSILFPLSNWNTADKDGWVANFRWTKTGFGFIPLTYQSRLKDEFWCYYTPFFIAKRDYKPLGYVKNREPELTLSSSDFTEFMLGYYGKNRRLDIKGWRDLYYSYALKDDSVRYKIWKSGRKPVKTLQERDALREEIAKDFQQYEHTFGGVFPLFHISYTPYMNRFSWNILGLLADYERSGNDVDFSLFTKKFFKYEYKERSLYDAVLGKNKSETDLFILPIFSGKDETVRVKVDSTVQKLRNLHHTADGKFARQLPKVNAALKALDPKAQVPAFINNETLLRIYIDDYIKEYIKDKKFEFYTDGKFFTPFYFYDWNQYKKEWICFPLLSGGKSYESGNWKWLSLLLLSGAGHNEYEDYINIIPPIAYMNKTRRSQDRTKIIHSSDAKWSNGKSANIESTDIYAACGLFYRGKVKFYVAKPGLDYKTLNALVASFNSFNWRKESLDREEKEYARELKLANAIKERNKIEYYEKMIALEKLKLRRQKIDKSWKNFKKDVAQTEKEAAKVNFKINVSNWADKKQVDKVIADLYAQTTEVRAKSDLGNGLFFRKENYYNGDWKWRIFLNMAGGEKDGDKESLHILHFLYRNRTDGSRTEKLIFPFIAIQKDGKDSKVSFFGRIYQKSIINGKTSGYIFFIPFGK